ncbi:putative PLAC8 family [Leishmania shawi]|uniref:PLAC8 family n=2 Tax=Viannia TaxID=37616 RepID=A0AAW3BGQ2_9TRYP
MPKFSNSGYSLVGQQWQRDAADVAVAETTQVVGSVTRPWHYSLCVTCTEMNSCLECYFCTVCQLSRQFNMFYNNTPELHLPVCAAVTALNVGGVPSVFVLEYIIRADIRRRYGIEGNCVKDCCVSWLCGPCAVQQQFLEMTSLGLCPGMSMCGLTPVVPESPMML